MSLDSKFYQFQLSFNGDLIKNSVDAYDAANTILATSQALREIAEIRYGKEATQDLKININAFQKGSLVSEFLIFINDNRDTALALWPYALNFYSTGKDILDTLKTVIETRKILKGEPAKEIKAIDNKHIKITAQDNSKTTINYFDFRGLQSKTITNNINKIIKPLIGTDSIVQNIEFKDKENQTEIVKINKSESLFFKNSQDVQLLEKMKYKGVITKIDTKACSGFIYIGSNRLSFHYNNTLSLEKFNILINSLKNKIQIFIIGKVEMDFENNPIHMQISDVESEIKLFD